MCQISSKSEGGLANLAKKIVDLMVSLDNWSVSVSRYFCTYIFVDLYLQVRAGSLQELVYKNGQAGISKATVSVTFDNSKKEQSPLGYEQYDEITVTRQVRTDV